MDSRLLIDSPLLDDIYQVRDFISQHYGIHHGRDRLPDLDRKLNQITQQLGYQQRSLLCGNLLSGKLSASELQLFIEALTVGETYFFREPDALDALINTIIPVIRQQQGRKLKIWSAGCASGEEPYSLAMTLDAQLPDAEHWDISILATDINQQSLQKAIQGNYKTWSFRATPTHYKQRYFDQQSDGSFQLHSHIRNMVQFNPLNLAQQDYPSPSNGTHQVDVLFCRNVLMYFSAETIREIVSRFSRALTPGGWLIVSQTECSHYFQPEFETIQCGNAFLFRKKDIRHPRKMSLIPDNPAFTPPAHYLIQPQGHPDAWSFPVKPDLYPAINQLIPQKKQISSAEHLVLAQELANQGLLDEAHEHCVTYLSQHKLDTQAHYLHAMILQELDKPNEAREALRRVLYLQPDMIMAIYTLGNLEKQQGHAREALRHFDNALRFLTMHENDDLLPHSEGLSVGQLRELLIQLRMEA
jgi:Methylase of chemotaxis methyl-accepting proteins